MKKELTCVVCPNGCQFEAEITEEKEVRIRDVDGSVCEKGEKWAEQELINPVRTIASSIAVEGGDLPLVSVRTDAAIPLGSIFDVMGQIKAARVKAPVHVGDILIREPAGTSCNIVATRNVQRGPASI